MLGQVPSTSLQCLLIAQVQPKLRVSWTIDISFWQPITLYLGYTKTRSKVKQPHNVLRDLWSSVHFSWKVVTFYSTNSTAIIIICLRSRFKSATHTLISTSTSPTRFSFIEPVNNLKEDYKHSLSPSHQAHHEPEPRMRIRIWAWKVIRSQSYTQGTTSSKALRSPSLNHLILMKKDLDPFWHSNLHSKQIIKHYLSRGTKRGS